jgi:hypothetical protein
VEKAIRQLSQERGEFTMQLAEALGATPQDIQDRESGIARRSVERLPNGQARAPGRLRS